MDLDPRNLDPKDRDALLRWRLALGPGAEQTASGFGLSGLAAAASGLGVDPVRVKDLDGALSFVYDEGNGAGKPPGGHLGDLVISVETAQRYARELGLSFAGEIEHLVIHGTLHLAGYDHEKDDGEMKRLERRLRRALLE